MASNERKFTIVIAGDTKGGEQAMSTMESSSSKLTTTLGKVGAAVGGVYAARKAFGFLSDSIKDAAEENQGVEILANTLKNTVGATDAQVASTEKWVTKLQNATGVMDDQLRPAMGKLLIGGRSVEQSQKDLAVALDIAAARGVDLDTVVTAMSKAALGNTGALGRLGIATKDASGATLSYDQILQEASRTMGGTAAAAADTAAGRAEILKAKYADLKENIGSALIPIMEKLTGVLSKAVDWFNSLSSGQQQTIVVIAAVVAAAIPLAAIISAVTTVVGGLTVALGFLAANPVVLVIAGIAALAAGLVWAYKNVGWFHDAVDEVAGVLQDTVWPVIKKVADIVSDVLTGYIKVLRAEWDIAWSAISRAVEIAWGVIRPIIDTMKSALDKITGPLKSVAGFAGNVGGAVGGALSHIPGFATGGLVDQVPLGQPMLAVVHGGEYVLPRGGSGSTGGLTINFNGPTDHDGAMAGVADALAQYVQRNGNGSLRALLGI